MLVFLFLRAVGQGDVSIAYKPEQVLSLSNRKAVSGAVSGPKVSLSKWKVQRCVRLVSYIASGLGPDNLVFGLVILFVLSGVLSSWFR